MGTITTVPFQPEKNNNTAGQNKTNTQSRTRACEKAVNYIYLVRALRCRSSLYATHMCTVRTKEESVFHPMQQMV